MRHALLASLLVPALALAGPFRDALDEATDQLEDAYTQVRRGGPTCRNTLRSSVNQLIDEVEDLQRSDSERTVAELRARVLSVAAQAPNASCPREVGKRLNRAADALEKAREVLARQDRRKHRDDDDDRAPGAPNVGAALLEQVAVIPQALADNEGVVRVDVGKLTLQGVRGQRFQLAARIRAVNGPWDEWLLGQAYTCPTDPFIWPNAQTFYFRHEYLRRLDTAQGAFVVEVFVLGPNNRWLGKTEVRTQVRLPWHPVAAQPGPAQLEVQPMLPGRQPPNVGPRAAPGGPPPPPPPPGAMAPPPPPPPNARDCGTGADPGCTVQRNGLWAMDRAAFEGFLTSLRAARGEFARGDIASSVLSRNAVTAMQLGIVLDQFASEFRKMEVAKVAAPRVVNPQAAVGLSAKFSSTFNQREFVELMSRQR